MLMIFGGEQFYASGGINDFLCMVEESKAQFIAYNLIGKTITYVDKWDTNEDFAIKQTIEWAHVATQKGIILHTFGNSYGPPLGKRIIEYLEKNYE